MTFTEEFEQKVLKKSKIEGNIKGTIQTLKSFDQSPDMAKEYIMHKFDLTSDKAETYMRQYY